MRISASNKIEMWYWMEPLTSNYPLWNIYNVFTLKKNPFLMRVWHGVARIQEQRTTALLSRRVRVWNSELLEKKVENE